MDQVFDWTIATFFVKATGIVPRAIVLTVN
jgi:hypothetical protein